MFKTEHDFILPIGFLDANGRLHREGTMRLITAKDEIETANEPKVRRNPAYMSIQLLSRVITRLGPLKEVDADIIETLFQTDFDFLQELFNRINREGEPQIEFSCSQCGAQKRVDLAKVFEHQTREEETGKVAAATITET